MDHNKVSLRFYSRCVGQGGSEQGWSQVLQQMCWTGWVRTRSVSGFTADVWDRVGQNKVSLRFYSRCVGQGGSEQGQSQVLQQMCGTGWVRTRPVPGFTADVWDRVGLNKVSLRFYSRCVGQGGSEQGQSQVLQQMCGSAWSPLSH
ncbi:hypothetical protein BsWGS_15640 [Bradybaena similaris]